MKTRYKLLLMLPLTISFQAGAESVDNYFDNSEPMRYQQNNNLPPEELDNRFDREPRLYIEAFDTSALNKSAEYGISDEEIFNLIEKDRKSKGNTYTVAHLNDLMAKLTRYYREHGLLLAQVYIPQQMIKDNTVVLGFAAGEIGAVNINANEFYSSEVVRRPFRNLIGKPVESSSLEAATMQVRSYPGYQAKTTFSPGEKPGSTQITVTTLEEDRVAAVFNVDNYGSDYTGKYRTSLTGYINNPTGNADQLILGGFITLNPTNSLYGNILYRLPLMPELADSDSYMSMFNPLIRNGMVLDAGYTQNTYSVGQELEELDITGEASTLFAGITSNLKFTNRQRITGTVRLNTKTAKTVQNDNTLAEDKLTTLELSTAWTFRDYYLSDRPAATSLSFAYYQGLAGFLGAMSDGDANSRSNASGDFAPAGFSKFEINMKRQQPIDTNEATLALRIVQTGDMLTPIEQTPIGGPYAVRGYQTGDFNADSAVILNAEYAGYSNSKLSLPIDNLKAGLFIDYAAGWRNDALANESEAAHMLAAGWFAEFIKEKKFNARLFMGIPLTQLEPADGSSFQLYFTLQRRF